MSRITDFLRRVGSLASVFGQRPEKKSRRFQHGNEALNRDFKRIEGDFPEICKPPDSDRT